MRKTRFGIIGCGSAALPVCQAIANSALSELAIVHDLDESLARELGQQYNVPHTTDPDRLFSADADAVYIAVPHDLLAPLANVPCLRANMCLSKNRWRSPLAIPMN